MGTKNLTEIAGETPLIRKIDIALEFAGQADRGIIEGNQEDLSDLIIVRDASPGDFIDIWELADAFRGFAMNVRAAERKSRAIAPYAGETDLPKRKPA